MHTPIPFVTSHSLASSEEGSSVIVPRMLGIAAVVAITRTLQIRISRLETASRWRRNVPSLIRQRIDDAGTAVARMLARPLQDPGSSLDRSQ